MTFVTVSNDGCFSRDWPHPVLAPEVATLAVLKDADIVVVGDIVTGSDWPARILAWKRSGSLKARVIFATYKGRNFWSLEDDMLADAWVAHCRSDCRSKRHRFVPLAFHGKLFAEPGGYIFCGGRKRRNFELARMAIPQTETAIFQSDCLPPWPGSKRIKWQQWRVPLAEYVELIGRSKLVLVPVAPGPEPHGHCDVVRALRAGKPVVVTRGGSCDDYVDGHNGVLVDYTDQGFADGIAHVLAHLDEMTEYCLETRNWLSPERYNCAIEALIDEVSRR